MKKNPNNYVDNQKFLEAIRSYKEKVRLAEQEGKEKPRIPEYVGYCLLKIAQNYFKKSRFRDYSYEDEMVSEAVKTCITYFDRFDETRSNPFAYFTSIIHNSFFQVINAEERLRYKMLKNFTTNVMVGDAIEGYISENALTSEDLYDNMYSFIGSYEKRENEKKARAKAKSTLLTRLKKEKIENESRSEVSEKN